jgi:hypothetical protein
MLKVLFYRAASGNPIFLLRLKGDFGVEGTGLFSTVAVASNTPSHPTPP